MVLGIILAIVVYYLIAEFLGRAKHIGRWWTFFLLLAGIFPGVIALIFSPSAKKRPTAGGGSYKFWAIVCIIIGIIGFVGYLSSQESASLTFLVFIISGIYLLQLSNGKVINNNPKYYLDTKNRVNTNVNDQPVQNHVAFKNEILDIDNVRSQLISLKNSKVLTEEEFLEKMSVLDAKALEEKITNTLEYIDLKSLTANGILSEEEFKLKVDQLREKYRHVSADPPSFAPAKNTSDTEQIVTPDPLQQSTPPPFKF